MTAKSLTAEWSYFHRGADCGAVGLLPFYRIFRSVEIPGFHSGFSWLTALSKMLKVLSPYVLLRR